MVADDFQAEIDAILSPQKKTRRKPAKKLGFTPLTIFADELYDHYLAKGSTEKCPDRIPAGTVWRGPTSRDAHICCRSCTWAPHCLSSDVSLTVDVPDVEEPAD